MNKFLNIEDVADDRGEEPAKVARMLTRKKCKFHDSNYNSLGQESRWSC